MREETGVFKGARGLQLYYRRWLPDDEPKAVLVIVHGLAEHCGRYGNVINHLVPLGYAVHGFDLPGHGRSEGQRVYIDHFSEFTDALDEFLAIARRRHPEKPLFLLGHSMGGLIVARFLVERDAGVAGAIVSAPAVKLSDDIPLALIWASRVLSRILPRVGLKPMEAEGISRDPTVVKAYVNDPLVYTGKITARLGDELLRAGNEVRRNASSITVPLLILQGSGDRLVDPGGAQLLYDALSATDKTLKLYEGLYHEVMNEPERERVLADVHAWLEEHINI